MATRTLSRRALRDQNDAAEQSEDASDDIEATDEAEEATEKVKKPRKRKEASAKPARVKAPAKPRATRKKADKTPPRRMARWAVCDGGLKRMAVFDYKDRAGADAKLDKLREEKKGPFVIQLVKDPYDVPEETVPVAV